MNELMNLFRDIRKLDDAQINMLLHGDINNALQVFDSLDPNLQRKLLRYATDGKSQDSLRNAFNWGFVQSALNDYGIRSADELINRMNSLASAYSQRSQSQARPNAAQPNQASAVNNPTQPGQTPTANAPVPSQSRSVEIAHKDISATPSTVLPLVNNVMSFAAPFVPIIAPYFAKLLGIKQPSGGTGELTKAFLSYVPGFGMPEPTGQASGATTPGRTYDVGRLPIPGTQSEIPSQRGAEGQGSSPSL